MARKSSKHHRAAGAPPPVKAPAFQAPSAVRRALSAVRGEWVAAVFSFVLIAWLVTEGDWRLFRTTGLLESFFDAQAQSLLHGHWDVPRESIGTEAWVHDGKSYGYFGPTPALFRIPLVLLLPRLFGLWSRLSMLAATALMLAALLLLIRTLEAQFAELAKRRLWAVLRPALVLAAAVGSTQLVVCSESKVYEESIVWAASLALAHSAFLVRYLTGRGERWLYLSCGAALLAFFARVSSGFGPIFAIFVLDAALALPLPRFREYWAASGIGDRTRAMAALSATLAASFAGWAMLNSIKFGKVFVSQPISQNLQFTPERVALTKGTLVSLANLPMTLWAYFSPAAIQFSHNFPWVFPMHYGRDEVIARFPAAHLDYVEYFAGIPAAMPALLFAAIAGSVLCFGAFRKELRAFRLPLIGGLAGCGLFLLFGMITERYEHDALPWLAPAAAIGAVGLVSIERAWLRRSLGVLFVAATIWSMGVNFALAIFQQNQLAVPVQPQKWAAFADLSTATSPRAVWSQLVSTRIYVPAASLEGGNLKVNYSLDLSPRKTVGVLAAVSAPPYQAKYSVEIPAAGEWELSVLCGSDQPRPVILGVNGRAVGRTCALATGGPNRQMWIPSGRYPFEVGRAEFAVASGSSLPSISMFRFVKMD